MNPTFCKTNCDKRSGGLSFVGKDNDYSVAGIGVCEDTDISIPAEYNGRPVTSIGEFVFVDCKSLKSTVIPDSVTSIGPAAFYRCCTLMSVTVPISVTSINEGLFFGGHIAHERSYSRKRDIDR